MLNIKQCNAWVTGNTRLLFLLAYWDSLCLGKCGKLHVSGGWPVKTLWYKVKTRIAWTGFLYLTFKCSPSSCFSVFLPFMLNKMILNHHTKNPCPFQGQGEGKSACYVTRPVPGTIICDQAALMPGLEYCTVLYNISNV